MEKIILHVDLNNFYASVEQLDHPEWKKVPMAVGGNKNDRHGIILAKNYPAKALGIKTGETLWEARIKSPNLIFVPPHFQKYLHYSKAVKRIYYKYTDMIESFGMDECWLDVTGSQKLFGSGKEIADKIRNDVREETGLTVSVGVSFTKIFAKLGSDIKKPDATTVISKDNFKQIAWNAPIGDMLFVGPKTQFVLHRLGVKTIGDLAKIDVKLLADHFGVVGNRLHLDANGIELSKVLKFDEAMPIKSVGNGTTTIRDMVTCQDVKTVIYYLAEEVSMRLRGYEFMACGVAVHIRNNKLKTITRQMKLCRPTNDTRTLAKHAFELFNANYNFKRDLPVRTLTIQAINLISENMPYQINVLELGKQSLDVEKKLGKQIDILRDKFGVNAITRASFMATDLVSQVVKSNDMPRPFQRGNNS